MIIVECSGKLPATVSEEMIQLALHQTCIAVQKRSFGMVSVAFISSQQIRVLNKKWRNKDTSTDVLSFAPAEIPGTKSVEKMWGDLFLNTKVIQQEAKKRSISVREEVMRDVIHGLLHLFGYDHVTVDEETKMFGLQERILSNILSAV